MERFPFNRSRWVVRLSMLRFLLDRRNFLNERSASIPTHEQPDPGFPEAICRLSREGICPPILSIEPYLIHRFGIETMKRNLNGRNTALPETGPSTILLPDMQQTYF